MSRAHPSSHPPSVKRLRLHKRAERALRQRAAAVGDALGDWGIPLDRDTALVLVALGLQELQRTHCTDAMVLSFCRRVLETPAEPDPRADTRGT